jgi:putative two-component system response regulator
MLSISIPDCALIWSLPGKSSSMTRQRDAQFDRFFAKLASVPLAADSTPESARDNAAAASEDDPLGRKALTWLQTTAHGVTVANLTSHVDQGLGICQQLYGAGRSLDALPIVAKASALAHGHDDADLQRRTAGAHGIVLCDTSDLSGALDQHLIALRIAIARRDAPNTSRAWNNIGTVFQAGGKFAVAQRAYVQAIDAAKNVTVSLQSRAQAFGNSAYCCYRLRQFVEGLEFVEQASREMDSLGSQFDPHSRVLLHRNAVHLLLGSSQHDHALTQVKLAEFVASQYPGARLRIACQLARAAWEIATGQIDVGLTRFQDTLRLARGTPAALPDALSSIMLAEESAGNHDRAMVYWRELSGLSFERAAQHVKKHVETSVLSAAEPSSPWLAPQDWDEVVGADLHSRLLAGLPRPSAPAGWPMLSRIARGVAHSHTVFRGETLPHSDRISLLARLLALSLGHSPIEAHEIALAAELHDIGLSAPIDRVFSTPPLRSRAAELEVEQHCVAGAQMLDVDSHARLLLAREVAFYHHAHWDGSGFPHGVGGEAIPLAARICAIADHFDDALTKDESEGGSIAGALEHLELQAGHVLDPQMTRRFVAAIKREAAEHGVAWLTNRSREKTDEFAQLIAALADERGVF